MVYTEWFHSDCLADYYHVDVFSEEYWRIVENFLRKAKERGVNIILTPILTLPLETLIGGERTTTQLVGGPKRMKNIFLTIQNSTDGWTYYCVGQGYKVSNRFITMPGWRTRILGVQLYKYRMEGFLHWGFNFYNTQYSLRPVDPYRENDADDAFPAGDAFIVYPGENGEEVESMRLPLIEVQNIF